MGQSNSHSGALLESSKGQTVHKTKKRLLVALPFRKGWKGKDLIVQRKIKRGGGGGGGRQEKERKKKEGFGSLRGQFWGQDGGYQNVWHSRREGGRGGEPRQTN